MNTIKEYKVVIAVVLPILILVLIRSFGVNHFKTDAKKWAEPSVSLSNIITLEKSANLPGKRLIIKLDKNESAISSLSNDTLNIPPDSILTDKYFNTIRKHKGAVLLYASETAVSARIWMILSQMGYSNVYILTNEADNEVFKDKFRPDTLTRPEF